MVPFIGSLIGGGISAVSGSINNLFSGEGRERRQEKRKQRKLRRALRKETRAGVLRAGVTPRVLPGIVAEKPTVKRMPGEARLPIGLWIQENWYFVAGGAAVVFMLFWLLGRKKKSDVMRRRMAKARRARKNPSNPGSGSGSKSSKKSSTGGTFAIRTRRVNREWKKAKASGSKIGRKAAWAKWG